MLHGMDTRAKVFGAVCLSLVLATTRTPEVAIIGLLLGGLLTLMARLPMAALIKRLLLINGFTLFLWIMLPLTYGHDTVPFGPLQLSSKGCALAWLITLKTNGIVCIMIALLTTSTVPDIGRALRWWKVPDKLCLILVFSYRYLFVIHDEYVRLRRAATMRCFSPSTNLATYRTFGNLVGMTLVRSYNRSQRVGQAMRLRCFEGRFHSLTPPGVRLADIIAGGVLVLFAVFLFIMDK